MERTTVKLTKLVAGPNPRSDINRVPIDDLLASIPVRGLLMPLIVSPTEKGRFAVRSGGRRLRALQKLYKAEAKTYDVPVVVIGEDEAPDEVALIDNIQRVPLHPVDEYHQYSALVDKGLTQPEIAVRFGVPVKWVGQRLQLAKLAPEILKMWRAGKLDADQAAALSANPDHATQNMVWERAKDEWTRKPDRLRHAVLGAQHLQSSASFKFVGAEAYELAGGEYSDDLFTEDRLVLNPVLLMTLEQEKLANECRRLMSEGWKWARTENDVGGRAWNWPVIDVTPWARPEEKVTLAEGEWHDKTIVKGAILERMLGMPSSWPKGGVIVGINIEGEFDHRYFLAGEMKAHNDNEAEPETDAYGEPVGENDTKNDTQNDTKTTSPLAIPEDEPKVNFKLREDMAEVLSLAVAEALSQDGAIALAALMATLRQQVAGGYGSRSPLNIKIETWGPNAPDPSLDAISWEWAFENEVNGNGLAYGHLIGRLVDLRYPQYDPKQWTEIGRKRMVRALCAALNPEALRLAIEERFDRSAYFARIPYAKISQILRDELGFSGSIAAQKGPVVALAARLAADQGWLPPDLAYALPRQEQEG